MTPPLPCPIRDACGGCGWMDREIDAQRAEKARRVERSVGRAPDRVIASPRALNYRARIQMRPDGVGRLGYSPPRSHDVVSIPACAIARPELNAALEGLTAALPDARGLQDIALRSGGAQVALSARARKAKRARQILARVDLAAAGLAGIALNGRRINGDPTIALEVAGIRHRLGPETFYQVNLEANALLVDQVVAEVERLAPAGVLDAYAGAGNLSLPLADRGIPVTLLEREGAALRDARATAERHGLTIQVLSKPAERLRAGEVFFDVAILDPPRAGARELLPQLLLTRPRAIVYVSCNPDTLGRDLGTIRAAGYELTGLTVYDFFPHTPHVETLAVLER